MDLEKLRAINWAQTWRLVAEKDLVSIFIFILLIWYFTFEDKGHTNLSMLKLIW